MNKQLNFFQGLKDQPAASWKLYIDGASRANPGLAGAGIYILNDGHEVLKQGFFLGFQTNNQAEYLALLLGLYFVLKLMDTLSELIVLSDSELLIKQFQGVYRVKDEKLKRLYQCAQGYLSEIKEVSFVHINREKNTTADKLANEGIDKKLRVPDEFIQFCKIYGITHLL